MSAGEGLPEGGSHLLAADDALIPGRWGAHVTLSGLQVRAPGASAAEDVCDVRYCSECVAEAARWSAEAAERVSGAVDQMATR